MQNNECLHIVKKWKKLKGQVADVDHVTGRAGLGTQKVGICEICKQEVTTFVLNNKSAKKLTLGKK